MGRRGGRYPSSTLLPAVIKARIASCRVGQLSPDDIADHLYTAYDDYKHFKLIPFRLKIRQHLHDVCVPKPNKKRKRVADASASEISSGDEPEPEPEPEFDVMKSMLRAGYRDQSKSTPLNNATPGVEEEMNLDIEVLKKKEKNCANSEPELGFQRGLAMISTNDSDDDEPPPRFSDFGGIKKEL